MEKRGYNNDNKNKTVLDRFPKAVCKNFGAALPAAGQIPLYESGWRNEL